MNKITDPAELADWDRLDALKFLDEEAFVEGLLKSAPLGVSERYASVQRGRELVQIARSKTRRKGMMESFLEEFGLSNSEGLALMCLAEALLRVPDADTRDDLIAEKIRSGDWASHQGQSDSWLVNASTWGLMLTGKVIGLGKSGPKDAGAAVKSLVRNSGEPVIRAAMMQAMRIMGEQFVLGRTVEAAIKRGGKMVRAEEAAHFSFDMLGEGARTKADAVRYLAAYEGAIEAVANSRPRDLPPEAVNGVSVKLSALHPRYEAVNELRVFDELYPVLLRLCQQAAEADVHLCLDAEEADRLVLSLKLFAKLATEPSLVGWSGLGLAVQAYQKRAGAVIDQLIEISGQTGRRFMLRLVKGAYWDSEIKHAQEEGHPNFPVFTTKQATDVNYLACAKKMLNASPSIYPQFATHNAHSLAAIERMAGALGVTEFEYQRLHGMGEALYDAAEAGRKVRVYAPVGAHEDLLPYLVRRLLENGANTSFVHSFLDADVPVEHVVEDPFAKIEAGPRRHPRIPTPPRLYGPERPNSTGLDLSQRDARSDYAVACAGLQVATRAVAETDEEGLNAQIAKARGAQPAWDRLGGNARAIILRQMGDALEASTSSLMALMAREAGKTMADGIAEVREAVDFCRYYASEAERKFAGPQRLPGPAGETNHLSLHGRGVFACISPWNFPLAIFTGQIAAALAAGNGVVAKPAEQTPRIAMEAVRLFGAAGLPENILQLVYGAAETGSRLTKHAGIDGVCFTGGTGTARIINQTLAAREGPIIPLIAETGGLNAMFVDTTALREQVIDDMIVSAFGSAGQRCSALRLAFLPHDTADMLIEGLTGAMDELSVADPALPTTDIGPVIDVEAHQALAEHLARMTSEARLIKQVPAEGALGPSPFFGPALVELSSIDQIREESFGPILHVLRYDPDDVAQIGAQLAGKGYGLTLGVHSRLDQFAADVRAAVPAGNCYVNRTMIGAVVGVQPFGGEGLSGTGPKAGGPHYLVRFATERVVTVNITAQGGDPELLSL